MPDTYTGGFFQTHGYLVPTPSGGHLLVDAPEGVAAWLASRRIRPAALLLTHQHHDHVADAARLASLDIPVYAWSDYQPSLTIVDYLRQLGLPLHLDPFPVHHVLAGLAEIEIEGHAIRLAHVPGHSPDSLTYYFPATGELYAGDTLFADSIGRPDLPGGNQATLLAGIRRHLLTLPPSTTVYPGHGPFTTIAAESSENPYLT